MPVDLATAGVTHQIIDAPAAPGGRAIKCLTCGHTSYNPNDVEQRYCGFCRKFHNAMSEQHNPEVVKEFQDQWHKICAALMLKLGAERIEFTTRELEQLLAQPRHNIAIMPIGHKLTIWLVTDEEGRAMGMQP